jgi:hypothetical protein
MTSFRQTLACLHYTASTADAVWCSLLATSNFLVVN